MLDSTRAWFRRNRTPIAIGAGVLGAGYLAGQYVVGKLNETRQKMSDERIAKDNLRRRFAQNQEDCTYTVLALLPTATDNIVSALPVEKITQELQARRGERGVGSVRSAASSEYGTLPTGSSEAGVDGDSATGSFVRASQAVGSEEGDAETRSKSKLQLWNDVKIYAFTRAFALIYIMSLLSLLTRIQLNLLGRRNYLSSVVSLASPSSPNISLENRDDDDLTQDYGSDFDTNRMYLTFSWWLLHRGWDMIRQKVEAAVSEVLEPLSARDSVSFQRLSECVLELRRRVEGATEEERRHHPWLDYVLPGREDEDAVLKESGIAPTPSPVQDTDGVQRRYPISQSLRRLLDETSDIIESPTFSHVLTLMLDSAFSRLIDEKVADQAYHIPFQNSKQTRPQTEGLDDLLQSNPLLTPHARVQEVSDDQPEAASQSTTQTTCKLATTLAVITRQAHVIGSGGNIGDFMASSARTPLEAESSMNGASFRDANEYLAAMEAVREVEAFAAVVYSSNFELEGVEGANPEGVAAEEKRRVEDSLVDVGRDLENSLESAWGKATETDR